MTTAGCLRSGRPWITHGITLWEPAIHPARHHAWVMHSQAQTAKTVCPLNALVHLHSGHPFPVSPRGQALTNQSVRGLRPKPPFKSRPFGASLDGQGLPPSVGFRLHESHSHVSHLERGEIGEQPAVLRVRSPPHHSISFSGFVGQTPYKSHWLRWIVA
jgi:hypothetical protein